MHELSIAMEILRIIENDISNKQSKKVTEIELDIGQMAGVDIGNLRFVLENISSQALFDGCRIHINTIQPLSHCNLCGAVFPVRNLFESCAVCHSSDVRLVCGNELKIKSYVIE